jgi:tripartite-type tricarboxylate transporter receptor subunit TctC
LAAVAFAAVAAGPGTLKAQEAFPTRPIHVVVPFAAGGAADIVSRVISNSISTKLGQAIVVENKPGATGTVGSQIVARAAPDGYTMLTAVISSHAVSPATKKNPPFDPINDFSPVVRFASSIQTLVVRKSFPATDLKGIIAYAKNNPGKVTYASSGPASFPWLGAKLMEQQAGIEMLHVPFLGDGPAMNAVAAEQVDLLFTPSAQGFVDGGLVKVVGVASLQRVPSTPSWPTLDESGLPGFTLVSWVGFMAPKGTPDARVELINKAVNEALVDPTVRSRLEQVGYLPAGGSPADYRATIKNDIDRIRSLGILFDD